MFSKIKRNIEKKMLGFRGALLSVLQVPLWVAAPILMINGRFFGALVTLLCARLVQSAARITRDYFQAIATIIPPEKDRRLTALAYLSLATFLLVSLVMRRPPQLSLFFTLISGLAYAYSYGVLGENSTTPQPFTSPQREIPDELPPTLKKMLTQGYEAIEAMENAANRLNAFDDERRIGEKLLVVTKSARAIIKHIEHCPESIRAARAFLVVHLTELDSISEQYLKDIGHPDHGRQQLSFYHLLCESEQSFTAQQLQLSSRQQEQLDIRMQVLREQLKQSNPHDKID